MMKYLVLLLLTACSTNRVPTYTKSVGSNAHAGVAYEQSVFVACFNACEWPEDYPGVDDPGAAYKEGQAAAEDADCHEDSEDPEDPDEEDNGPWF